MPKIDLIVGSAIIVYFATVITEIVSAVPIGLTQTEFGDHCILSASVSYFVNGTFNVNSFGNPGACGYCTYLTIGTVLYALGYGSYSAYALYRSVDNAALMWVLPAMMVCALFLVLKFISSCILSAGFSKFCKSVASSADISNCQAGQSKDWYYKNDKLNGGHYYAYMTTAQSASWFCVFEWTVLLILTFLHYRRNISLRSSGVATSGNGFGFGASDTSGIVANEILPG